MERELQIAVAMAQRVTEEKYLNHNLIPIIGANLKDNTFKKENLFITFICSKCLTTLEHLEDVCPEGRDQLPTINWKIPTEESCDLIHNIVNQDDIYALTGEDETHHIYDEVEDPNLPDYNFDINKLIR